MITLIEYSKAGSGEDNADNVPYLPKLKRTLSAAATSSTPANVTLQDTTKIIRVTVDAVHRIAAGNSVGDGQDYEDLAAGTYEFGVNGGEDFYYRSEI